MITFVISKSLEFSDYVLRKLLADVPANEREYVKHGEKLADYMGGSLFSDSSTLILNERPDNARIQEISEASQYGDIILTWVNSTPKMRELSQTRDVQFIEFTSKKPADNVRSFLDFTGLPFTLDSRNLIVDHVRESAEQAVLLCSEIEQVFGGNESITENDVRQHLGEPGLRAVWDLTDTIDTGNVPKSLEVLENLLQDNSPHALVSVLLSHYSKIFYLYTLGKSNPQADEAPGARLPYPVVKAQRALRRYGANALVCYSLVSDASADMKGIKRIPPHTILEILVGRLASMSA